ncbi:hypothetical protein CM50_17015 [Bacillus subtilis]|nr:hypothetical protein CM50_17015 [Bacillus subtilis] [Bacillus stercoris]
MKGNCMPGVVQTRKLDLIVRALFSGLLRKLVSLFLEYQQEQHGATKKISEKEATVGDLVFFGGTYEGKAITHVSINVGNGRMFHSNDSGIKYSDLKSGYWRDHLVSFGRIK